MRIKEWLTPSNPCRQFSDNEHLFQALKSLDNKAILCVQSKAAPSARRLTRQYGLDDESADEIVNQSTLILLRKITDGSYQFQGHAPASYLIEIMKRVALNMKKGKRTNHETTENYQFLQDPDIEDDKRRREAAELVSGLLNRMGEPCQTVVRLYHIEGYADDEVVRQGWTIYTTVGSLKMKRSDCMKKLIEIARQWKTTNSI